MLWYIFVFYPRYEAFLEPAGNVALVLVGFLQPSFPHFQPSQQSSLCSTVSLSRHLAKSPSVAQSPLDQEPKQKNPSARGTGISRFSVKPLLPERSMISQLLSRVWPLLVLCWVLFRGREKSKCSFRARQYEFLSGKLKTQKKPG